jgi:hypothetical protein
MAWLLLRSPLPCISRTERAVNIVAALLTALQVHLNRRGLFSKNLFWVGRASRVKNS